MTSLPETPQSANGHTTPWYLDNSLAFMWTDADIWQLNDPAEVERLEEAERERLEAIADGPPYEPSAEDWADYRAWAEALDRQRGGPMTDADVAANGLPIG
jgi:hypothetical protein